MYLLSSLLFWQDVTEYGAAEDRSADRLLRLHRAWDIFNTYLSIDSRHSIGKQVPKFDVCHILSGCKDCIKLHFSILFAKGREHRISLILLLLSLSEMYVSMLKE